MANFTTKLTLSVLLSFLLAFTAEANDSDIVNCNHAWKIAVLGSSTSFGTGASTYDSSWVGKFTTYVQRKNAQSIVYNLGIPGFTSYQNLCPTGFSPPANRPLPNSSYNITAALALHPDAIILNLPSNDAANDYSLQEQMANFEITAHLADSANIPLWVSTTQPRNNMTTAQIANLAAMRDWIISRFGDKAVDFWSTVANGDGSINPYYDYDYVHVNNLGHDLFYNRIKAETILDSLCIRVTPYLLARAGNDKTVTLPASGTVLDGSASYSSLGGIITSYHWALVAGPQNVLINTANNVSTTISNLAEGRYSFSLTVTDNSFNTKSDTVDVVVNSRILIDFGPENSASPDVNGNYWNNIAETQAGIKLTNAVTTGNIITGIGLQVINRIDGTFNTAGPGTNTGNSLGAINDYPASATNDFSFAEPSATNGQWKITGLESTKQYIIKFWGTRTVTDDRIIQVKRADQTAWQEYNATNNSNYNSAAVFTFSGKTEMTFDIRVKSGSAFGYICLVDIQRTTPLLSINVPPIARATDVSVALPATIGSLDGSGSTDDDGSITAYQWSQTSGPSIVNIVSPSAAITSITGLVEGIYTFHLKVTDDSSAIAFTDIKVTVNSRVLFDIGPDFTTGPDAGGKYWNNVADGLPGIKISNAVTTGNTATSIRLEVINRIDGTFNLAGPGTNTGNNFGDIGDYPASVTTDFAFAHSSATNGQWKVAGLDSTKQYSIKFWGTRSAIDERTTQIKFSDDSVWQEYEARNNTDYNAAAVFTFTGKTERSFDIRAKDNSTFGHVSLVDIRITNPPVNCTPAIAITSDQLAAVCGGTAISFKAILTNGGLLPAYQWKKNGINIPAANDSVYTATALSNNDSISCDVTINSNCGNGLLASSNKIAANILPAIVIGAISGPIDICPLTGAASTATYSIQPVGNENSYSWSTSPGATIASGQGTTSITVSFSSNFPTGGVIAVRGATCSNGTPGILTLVRNTPGIPGTITGPVSACSYLGTSAQVTYSVPVVSYAASYLWTLPANMTLISGQGTNTITVSFGSNFTTAALNVKAVSNCATSKESALTISTTITPTPGAITGPTEACPYIGTGLNATYTIRKVTGATSYNWTVPAGATIAAHPGGAGLNDTIITVTYNSSFVSGSVITVQAAGCILGAPVSITILKSAPATAGIISGPTEACPYIGTGLNATYTIRKVAGATSYNWSVPVGALIASHPAGTGVNDTTITVSFSSSFVSGTSLSVYAQSCLPGQASSIAILKTTPGAPGAITGPTEACPYIGTANLATYLVRKVPGATSYIWTLPAGVSLSAHPAGTGVNDTIINVTFNTGFVSGTAITVSAASCLTGPLSSLQIVRSAPATPGAISGPAQACGYVGTATTATYSIRKVPGATSYIWTVPAGITISSHPAGAGVNDTIVKVLFNNTFVSGTSIAVQASSCQNSAASTIAITWPIPATPPAIIVLVSPCIYQNNAPVGGFSIPKTPGVTYNWIVPAGSTVYHASLTGTSDSIGVIFPSNFTSGTISVTASNSCGTNPVSSTVALTVVRPATLSLNLSGPSNPCPYIGTPTGAIYKVNRVPGISSYTWTVPSAGVTVVHPNGTGSNDTLIVVTFTSSYNNGNISVAANTLCGTSPVKTINLNKNAPATPGSISSTLLATCPLRKYTFSIASLPADATSTQWSVPAGATILSGQGTNTITVTFPVTTLIANVSVVGKNFCGSSSSARTTSITLPVCLGGRDAFAKNTASATTIKEKMPEGLDIAAMPNPTYNDFKLVIKSNDQRTPVSLVLTDVSGKVIETKTVFANGQAISLGLNYQKGVYIGEFIQGTKRNVVKLVKL